MKTFGRGLLPTRPSVVRSSLAPNERLLSWAEVVADAHDRQKGGMESADPGDAAGYIVVSDRRLILPGVGMSPDSIAWDQVLWARWDPPMLTIAGRVASTREASPGSGGDFTLRLGLRRPGNVPAHVQERIEATIVVQRRVELGDGVGARLVARRRPLGRDVTWFVVFDQGVDPGDPQLRRAADVALADFRASVGV